MQVIEGCENEVKSSILQISKLLFLSFTHFANEDHKELKSVRKQAKKLNKHVKEIKDNLPETLKTFKENEIDIGHYYVQVIDHLRETTNALSHIIEPAYTHLDNNHRLDHIQNKELKHFNEEINEFFNFNISILKNKNIDAIEEIMKKRDILIDEINEIIRNRIKILKKTQKGTKVSMTYIEMLTESKNLLLHLVQLLKADNAMGKQLKLPENIE